MKVEPILLKKIFTDKVFFLLLLNLILVIIGYAIVSAFGSGLFQVIKFLRVAVLVYGLAVTLRKNGFNLGRINQRHLIPLITVAFILVSVFKFDNQLVVYNLFTFLLGFFYLLFSINYLLKYNHIDLLKSFSAGIFFCFSIVILYYYLFGGSILATNIYGNVNDGAFVSNHYGWSASLVILSGIDLLRNFELKRISQVSLVVFLVLALYLMIISASRSSILAVFLTFAFLLFKVRSIGFFYKLFIIAIPLVFYFTLKNDQDSSINLIIDKSSKQIDGQDDGRLLGGSIMVQEFNAEPHLWFTGVGMFNYEYLEENNALLGKYHNSYFEVLFGAGIILFMWFLRFMVIRPLAVFFRTSYKHSLLILPLIIIPFFESDITPGQFLFFPWIGYMIILNAKNFRSNKVIARNE